MASSPFVIRNSFELLASGFVIPRRIAASSFPQRHSPSSTDEGAAVVISAVTALR
jgi:hypothetical protein